MALTGGPASREPKTRENLRNKDRGGAGVSWRGFPWGGEGFSGDTQLLSGSGLGAFSDAISQFLAITSAYLRGKSPHSSTVDMAFSAWASFTSALA